MGTAFGIENIPNLVVASTTLVTLLSTNLGKTTRINVGGQQYVPTATLTMNSGLTGAGGLDTGSLSAIQLWYVYAIVNQTTLALALVASTSAGGPLMPSGYGTAYKLVGAFYTNGSSQIGSMVQITGVIDTAVMSYTPTLTASPTNPTNFGLSGTWKRRGTKGCFTAVISSSTTHNTGNGNWNLSIPTGLAIATSGNRNSEGNSVLQLNDGSSGVRLYGSTSYPGTNTLGIGFNSGSGFGAGATFLAGNGSNGVLKVGGSSTVTIIQDAGNTTITLECEVDITGWNSTLF